MLVPQPQPWVPDSWELGLVGRELNNFENNFQGKKNLTEYNFLIWFVDTHVIVLCKKSENNFTANRKVATTLKFCSDYGKYMLFSLNFAWNGTILTVLKGNNFKRKKVSF